MINHDPPRLTFEPGTIQHLGPKLYSRLPDAIAELVANAYDADAEATLVAIRHGADGRTTIHVTDDGHGMTPGELRSDYLRIGRDRRAEGQALSRGKNRRVSGKKGLGKLALFGIGHTIKVATCGEGDPTRTTIELAWRDILAEKSGVYTPRVNYDDKFGGPTGTDITISDLQRKTEISPDDLATSLARLFTLTDADFELFVERADGSRVAVDGELRREAYDLEREYAVPDDIPADQFPTLHSRGIHGWVGFTKSTLRPESRGMTLFANGRRATTPSFFDAKATNFAYAYIVGEVDVDYIDDLVPDVIATARNGINNWEHPEIVDLRAELSELARFVALERRKVKSEANEKSLRDVAGIDRAAWLESLPVDVRSAVARVLNTVVDPDNEISTSEQKKIISGVHAVAPEYAELHWRHLDDSLKTPKVEEAYKSGRYDDAIEAALYATYIEVKKRLPHLAKEPNEVGVFQKAFSVDQTPRLEVIDLEGAHCGLGLPLETVKSFQVGTHALAQGVISGFRNPISHNTGQTLFLAGILEHADCLDGLSVLSHIARMVKRARVVGLP